MKHQNHRQMMIISQSIIFVAFFVNYATCRTAKDYREMPGVPAAAVRQSQVQQFPSYNLDAPDGPGTYAFGYEIEDSQTGNIQFRDEEKLRNGTIKGSYGVVAPDDTVRLTRYIADHLGYRTTQEEARKRNDNGPLKLEVQVQPTVKHQQQPLTGEQAIAAVTSSPTFDPYQSRNPQFDPTSIYHQQTNINSHPSFYGQPALNFAGELFDPAALLYEQQLSYPYGLPPGYQNEYPPFEGGLLRQSNQPGPVIGFLSNLVQHNPFTTFFNQINPLTQQQQQQTTTQNTPILNLLSNLNPLNLLTNNNNNNNRPTVTIPAVTVTSPSLGSFGIQSDYVVTSPSPSGQLVAIPSVPSHSLSGNIDTSVFSYGNDHYNYPNYQQNGVNYGGQGGSFGNYQPSYLGFNQQYSTTNRPFQTYPNNAGNFYQPHSYFYGNRQIPAYQNPFQTGAITPLIGVNPYGYYGNRVKTSMTKNGGKKKHNKNKDESEAASSWFENFLNQRKQTSLGDVTTSSTAVKQRRPTKAKPSASDEDNDSSGLDDYFR